ncbi:MAG: hypothetical protein E3J21_05050 [Anaerolineales bacterium]|nr:MAG: hypothetical protein E3J21_05050 [Anaerolineales bacterium]
MQKRQEQSETPYVLLLGSSLSLTLAVRRAFAGTEDWEAFWKAMQPTSPTERKVLLKKPLDALGLEPGYQAMAWLAEAGYFNLIFTLNVDDAIDDMVRPLPADQSVLLVYDGTNTAQIVETLSRATPRIKVIKLRGDINAQTLPLTATGQFEFPANLERSVSEWLKRDTILVGDIPYDTDVQRCIRRSTGALWCILPDEPGTNSFVIRAKRSRPSGEIVTGAEAEFNAFFTALRDAEQWEQVHRYQRVLDQGVWDEAEHDRALHELQSFYRTNEMWDEAIEAAHARVELAGVLASEQRMPSGHIATHEMDGFQRSRSLDLAGLYVEWARADAGGGRWQEAVDHLEEALEIYRELGEWSSEEATQSILAETYEGWARSRESMPKRTERAETVRAYRNAIRVYERLRDRDKLAALWHRLAQVHLQERRKRRDFGALRCLKESLDYQFDGDDTPRAPVDEIVANLQALFEIRARCRYWVSAVEALLKKAKILLWAERYPQAIRAAEMAVELCLDIDKPRLLLDSQVALARAYEAAGTLEDLENALAAYQQALDLAMELRTRSKIGTLRESIDSVSERIANLEGQDKANLGDKDAATS